MGFFAELRAKRQAKKLAKQQEIDDARWQLELDALKISYDLFSKAATGQEPPDHQLVQKKVKFCSGLVKEFFTKLAVLLLNLLDLAQAFPSLLEQELDFAPDHFKRELFPVMRCRLIKIQEL